MAAWALPLLSAVISGIAGSKVQKSSINSTAKVNKTTTGQQIDLAPELLAVLEGVLGTSLSSGGFEQSSDALSQRLNELQGFDAEEHAQNIADAAVQDAGIDLNRELNQLAANTGGTSGTNSMVAILGNTLRNRAATNFAGIRSGARLEAEKFKTEGINMTGANLSEQILGLLGSTRGARTSGQMTERGTESKKASGSQGGGIGGFFAGLSAGFNSNFNRTDQ